MKSDKKILSIFKLGDIFTVSAILVLALYFILRTGAGEERFKKLVLMNGSQTINLSWKNDTIDLKKLINKNMMVEVKDGKARVILSNCPDKVCVNTGWVWGCGHMAACLPNSVALLVDCQQDLNVTK